MDDLHAANKDYVKARRKINSSLSIESLWKYDHLPLVTLLNDVIEEVSSKGVKVIKNFGLQDFLNLGPYSVFTLVAHWDNVQQKVELGDGLTSIPDILEHIPDTFKGIYDLTICQSTQLQDALKGKYKNVVIANKKTTDAMFRLILYKHIIRLLEHSNKNYIEASTDLKLGL